MQINPQIQQVLTWIVLLGSVVTAIKIICSAVKDVMSASHATADRFNSLEERVATIEHGLSTAQESDRVIQKAILALLDHAIDGNNIHQLEAAKDDLQRHLIEK